MQMLKEFSYWLEVELIFFVFKAVHRNQSQLCYFVDYPESFYIFVKYCYINYEICIIKVRQVMSSSKAFD